MAQELYPIFPVRWLARNQFDNLRKIGHCKGPIAVAHGDCDELIPLRMGQKLYDAAPDPKRFFLMKDCGHNDSLPAELLKDLASFLSESAP
jgi:hypothetical protein